jgi:pimeloyl-ACP methyl ester carboxylesterase
VLASFATVPTTIICGTKDKLTSLGHSRKMASMIDGARLVECPGAGHMVIFEARDLVNAALGQLFTAASGR